MEKTYFALIGDIVNSRNDSDRGALQQRLNAALDNVNRSYRAVIAADFLITLGDEFQGLLFAREGADPLVIASGIMDAVFPARIRVAVGYGTMSTEVDRSAALGADGRAYHLARSGLDSLKVFEKYCASRAVFIGESEADEPVNALLLLLSALRRGRSARQNELASAYVCSRFPPEGGRLPTQKELSARLGITQGTFNVSLSASFAREYASGLAAAEKLLLPLKMQPRTPVQTNETDRRSGKK